MGEAVRALDDEGPSRPRTALRGVSARTWAVTLLGFAAAAGIWAATAVFLASGAERAALVVGDFGPAVLYTLAAVVVLRTALAARLDSPVGRQWLLIAIAVALFAMGDWTWSFVEVVQGVEVPYPGLPDLFYVIQYVFFGAALLLAGFGYRRLFDVRVPLALSAALAAAGVAGLYLVLLRGILGDPEIGGLEKALSALYPVADVVLMLAPAVFLALVTARLGAGRLALPWRVMAVGAAVLGLTDALYSWLTAQELYQTGSVIDMGWMLGFVLVAVAASVARDVY